MTNDTEPTYTLNEAHLIEAADWAAEQLLYNGVALVELQPGDGTRYDVLITAPRGKWGSHSESKTVPTPVVSLVNFGTAHQWSGSYMTVIYAAERWGAGNGQTGLIMSVFLNLVSAKGGFQ